MSEELKYDERRDAELLPELRGARHQGGIMTTDSERREVARRLRDMRLDPWDDAACEIASCAGIVCCNSECHGSDETPECTMALCDRLADLIDPGNDHFADATKW